MKILVELSMENEQEEKLKYDFMDVLVKDLKVRLLNHVGNVNPLKVQKAILSYDILWKSKIKPKEIDVINTLTEIITNIKWYEEDANKFIIQIDRTKKYSGTNTSLETVAKVIDYGSKATLPMRWFSKHFNFFTNEVRVYWSTYKQFRTKIKVKQITTIC